MRLFLLFLSIPFFALSKEKRPFSGIKADRVVIYDYEGHKGNADIIVDNKLNKTVRKKQVLTKQEIKELSLKLNQKSSYGGGKAFCFEPHLGVVYYSGDSVAAHVSICLECNVLSSSIEIPEQHQGKQGSGKEVYYILDGMSRPFRKYINGLVKRYNFSHPIPKGSMFDE